MLSAAKEFLNHLIRNSNLNSSTIEKHISHLRSYFKECLVVNDEELDDLNIFVQTHLAKPNRCNHPYCVKSLFKIKRFEF